MGLETGDFPTVGLKGHQLKYFEGYARVEGRVRKVKITHLVSHGTGQPKMAPSREAPKKRHARRSGWWFDIFDEMSRMDHMMEEMMQKAFTMPRAEDGPQPFVYGFSMSVGPDGKPVIREFGNVEPSSKGPLVKEEREPLVDVMQEGNDVVVVTELPGVEKDQIKLESTDRALKITVNSPKRRYLKELELPHLVDPRTSRATYKNGVLEVRFQKTEEKKPTRAIRVE